MAPVELYPVLLFPWSFRKYQGKPQKHQGFFSPSEPLKAWKRSRKQPKRPRISTTRKTPRKQKHKHQGKEGQGMVSLYPPFVFQISQGIVLCPPKFAPSRPKGEKGRGYRSSSCSLEDIPLQGGIAAIVLPMAVQCRVLLNRGGLNRGVRFSLRQANDALTTQRALILTQQTKWFEGRHVCHLCDARVRTRLPHKRRITPRSVPPPLSGAQ